MDRPVPSAFVAVGLVGWLAVRWLRNPRTVEVYPHLFDLCADRDWTVELNYLPDGFVVDIRDLEDGGDLLARGQGETAEDAAVEAATGLALSGRLKA